jgi:hypothetical protein
MLLMAAKKTASATATKTYNRRQAVLAESGMNDVGW